MHLKSVEQTAAASFLLRKLPNVVTHTDTSENLSGARNRHIFARDQKVAEETGRHRNGPHEQIRQRRVDAIVLDGELKHIAHIFGQIAHLSAWMTWKMPLDRMKYYFSSSMPNCYG